MSELKHSHYSQVLIYIHGQTSQPERDVFPMVEKLQQLFDRQEEDLVQVVPMIWPCYDPEVSETHFWSDQKSADSSEFAYGRVLESFMAWRESAKQDETPCLKRINILAHSMGARVIRGALLNWAKYDRGGSIPMIFRNIFLTAPDLGNDALQGLAGQIFCGSSRNVVVFYAADDYSLRASKIPSAGEVSSRRLGHTGPDDIKKTPRNVYAFDCDEFNNEYDNPLGHTYFLSDETGKRPGKVFLQIFKGIKSGRLVHTTEIERTEIL